MALTLTLIGGSIISGNKSNNSNIILNLPLSSFKIKMETKTKTSHLIPAAFSPHSCSSANTKTISHHHVFRDIHDSAVIACLRAKTAEVAFEAACAAITGGIKVLEITMSTPGVFEVLRCLVKEYPSASLGVGTVLDRADAKDALKSGAKFLMSPILVKEILDDVSEFQALYIPGAMTPTEILFASKAGAKIVKVYPVSALGGVHYITAIKKPFPHISMVASQGITLDSVGEYIAQGASSVVLSDAIFEKAAMDERNFDRINQLASLAAFRGNEALRLSWDKLL